MAHMALANAVLVFVFALVMRPSTSLVASHHGQQSVLAPVLRDTNADIVDRPIIRDVDACPASTRLSHPRPAALKFCGAYSSASCCTTEDEVGVQYLLRSHFEPLYVLCSEKTSQLLLTCRHGVVLSAGTVGHCTAWSM